jgi:hypothetical protein
MSQQQEKTRMIHRRLSRSVGALAMLALTVALPIAALASHGAAPHAGPAAATPEFVFGREGGNIRPLTVTIYSDGTVNNGSGTAATFQLSPQALAGLLKLAQAEGFYKLPPRIIGHGLPDIGGRFITITTAYGSKTVHVRFVKNAAFDQLYAVLSAVARLDS